MSKYVLDTTLSETEKHLLSIIYDSVKIWDKKVIYYFIPYLEEQLQCDMDIVKNTLSSLAQKNYIEWIVTDSPNSYEKNIRHLVRWRVRVKVLGDIIYA